MFFPLFQQAKTPPTITCNLPLVFKPSWTEQVYLHTLYTSVDQYRWWTIHPFLYVQACAFSILLAIRTEIDIKRCVHVGFIYTIPSLHPTYGALPKYLNGCVYDTPKLITSHPLQPIVTPISVPMLTLHVVMAPNPSVHIEYITTYFLTLCSNV